ncbi:hypothetical protein LXA43DRAFT_1102438 [Ganoderma leucocontextum]|nr:hypothetical protein LXA43DRAFT_1102438 [Ganoderma leucocontextum]
MEPVLHWPPQVAQHEERMEEVGKRLCMFNDLDCEAQVLQPLDLARACEGVSCTICNPKLSDASDTERDVQAGHPSEYMDFSFLNEVDDYPAIHPRPLLLSPQVLMFAPQASPREASMNDGKRPSTPTPSIDEAGSRPHYRLHASSPSPDVLIELHLDVNTLPIPRSKRREDGSDTCSCDGSDHLEADARSATVIVGAEGIDAPTSYGEDESESTSTGDDSASTCSSQLSPVKPWIPLSPVKDRLFRADIMSAAVVDLWCETHISLSFLDEDADKSAHVASDAPKKTLPDFPPLWPSSRIWRMEM